MSRPSPIRNPETSSPEVMTRRAWWLVALNFLIPGSAQLLAGNRSLGKIGIWATLFAAGAIVLGLILNWLWPAAIISLLTNPIVLTVGQVLLVCYCLLWLVLTFDTLRLVRLVRLGFVARWAVTAIALVGLVAGVGVAGFGAGLAGTARASIQKIFDNQSKIEPPADGRYNILLLGGDAGPDRMGLRPDSISVASIDAATGKLVMIGIPRNMELIRFVKDSPLYGPFPNGYDCGDKCLISYLYTYAQEHPDLYPEAEKNGSQPGIEAMRDAVEGVLGLKLQYFVLIDMQGFADLIDSLGGITLEVAERTPLAAAIPGAKPFAWVEKGTQHLDGETALWYSRSRFESSDYSRMSRQRDVQEAILRQFTPANVILRFQSIAEAGAQVVKTDIPSTMLGPLGDLALKARKLEVTRLELVPKEFDPAHPDYDKIAAAIEAAFNPATETPKPED
ncbi:MAG: LCP family protein [Cryobacterium sp.]|nr:LCP family protein [Cryobacterium sp.]